MFVRARYLIKETTFPYLVDQATHISAHNQLYFYSQKSNNILGNKGICLEVLKDVPTSYDFPFFVSDSCIVDQLNDLLCSEAQQGY